MFAVWQICPLIQKMCGTVHNFCNESDLSLSLYSDYIGLLKQATPILVTLHANGACVCAVFNSLCALKEKMTPNSP